MISLETYRAKLDRLEMKCLWSDSRNPFPTKGGDGGDDILWMGLLASSGHQKASDAVSHCQGPDGMFYRNPDRRDNNNAGHQFFFSRDMSMGVLLWCVKNGHNPFVKLKADQWIQWIEQNRACLVQKPKWAGKGCLVRSPVYRMAPDTRSDITPAHWDLIGKVWRHNGWDLNRQMRDNVDRWEDYLRFETQVTDQGYQLHLKALVAYLYFLMDIEKDNRSYIARVCYGSSLENPFFRILANEMVFDRDIQSFYEMIPDPDTFEPQPTWLWEQKDVVGKYNEKKYCGWDFVFLGHMIGHMYFGVY